MKNDKLINQVDQFEAFAIGGRKEFLKKLAENAARVDVITPEVNRSMRTVRDLLNQLDPNNLTAKRLSAELVNQSPSINLADLRGLASAAHKDLKTHGHSTSEADKLSALLMKHPVSEAAPIMERTFPPSIEETSMPEITEEVRQKATAFLPRWFAAAAQRAQYHANTPQDKQNWDANKGVFLNRATQLKKKIEDSQKLPSGGNPYEIEEWQSEIDKINQVAKALA